MCSRMQSMPTEPCHLLIVTVNYRTPHLTINSLRALAQEVQSVPGTRVVVVDNASGDGSVEQIQAAIDAEAWGEWASVLPSNHNGGFAYGNNLAIRPVLNAANPAAYYLLLNPDAEVRPNALKALVEFMDQHPDVGIAGSALENPDGSLWPYTFRFPTIWSELDLGLRLGLVSKLLSRWVIAQTMGDQPQQVDWLPGASMLIRRQVFEAVGLMDEDYFLYYEETDFCLQAKRAGWSCWYVPTSRVMHNPGQSTGVTVNQGPRRRRPQYVFDSRWRYFVKNHGPLYAVGADIAWILGFSLWRLRRVLQRKPDADPPELLGDSIRNSFLFRLRQGSPALGQGLG